VIIAADCKAMTITF